MKVEGGFGSKGMLSSVRWVWACSRVWREKNQNFDAQGCHVTGYLTGCGGAIHVIC